MQFLQAAVEDVNTIHKINQRYLRTNLPDNSKGFLLGTRTTEWISNNLNKYFVAKEGDQVLGYAEIDFKIGVENFATGTWESDQIQKEVLEKIDRNKFVYMIQLASNTQNKGVGKYITDGLSNKFHSSIIISFVAFKPHFNEVSLHFHEKAGFQKVGTFKMKSKFGIEDYERICYIK